MFETLMSGGHEQTRQRLPVDWQVLASHAACLPWRAWTDPRPTVLCRIVRGGHFLAFCGQRHVLARAFPTPVSFSWIGMAIFRMSRRDCYRKDAPTGRALHHALHDLNGGL